MSAASVTLAIEGALARVTLNQPARHNAMTLEMWRQLPDRIEAAVADPAVRAIVVTGAGERAFCSGADISQFGRNRADPQAAAVYDEAVSHAIERLRGARKPTIALIRGICFGGGLEIALCCDLRLASSEARCRVPAARLGLGYACHNVALLVERLGAGVTAEILFTAEVYCAERARSARIVHQVFPEADSAAQAEAYLDRISANAPLVLRAVKRALVELEKPHHERDVAGADAEAIACTVSRDYREGQAAFREKREPRFTGE